jgi:hypothetical protein
VVFVFYTHAHKPCEKRNGGSTGKYGERETKICRVLREDVNCVHVRFNQSVWYGCYIVLYGTMVGVCSMVGLGGSAIVYSTFFVCFVLVVFN